MTVSLKRIQVALKRPTKVPDLLVHAQAIVEGMTGNSWFSAPVPPLANVQAAIDKLSESEAAALARTRGLKDARDGAVAALVKLLTLLKAYVQGVADENPEFAPSIIESARMSVAAQSSKPKPALSVLPGGLSGSVRLVAKAVAKVASYEWQLRQSGVDAWVDLPRTLQAKTTVTGLKPAGTYSFRMRPVIRSGVGDWCDPLSYVVQ
ncbi:MAG: fibronectin type III domain-containing protein [Polyangiaceae bacterium]